MGKKAPLAKSSPTPPRVKTADPPVDWVALLRLLVKQAASGDREARDRLRTFLDKNPWLWRRAGDLAAVAEDAWVDRHAGPDALAAEAVKRVLAEMKAELKGPHPTRLEALLADRVAVTWLAAQHAEVQAAVPAAASLPLAAFRLKRAESAQRRHLAAVKTLATLRALVPRGMAPLAPLKLYAPDAAAG